MLLDDISISEEEEIPKNPLPINSLNIKKGITKYKMKLKEKKKLEENSEKNSNKNQYFINSKGKWWSGYEPGKKINKIKKIKKFRRKSRIFKQ